MSGETQHDKSFGYSEYEGVCRGPVGGTCGRVLSATMPMHNAHDPEKRIRCSECDTCNTVEKVVV